MNELIPCFSCAKGLPSGATEIATVPHKDGGGKIAFGAPLCASHAGYALVVGWYPIFRLESQEGQKLWKEHGWGNSAAKEPKP